jgi:hypothetical protein
MDPLRFESRSDLLHSRTSWHRCANSTIRLIGISNGQAWDVNEWGKTDAIGVHAATGTFAKETEGRHTLYVDVDGATSNDVSFLVSLVDHDRSPALSTFQIERGLGISPFQSVGE